MRGCGLAHNWINYDEKDGDGSITVKLSFLTSNRLKEIIAYVSSKQCIVSTMIFWNVEKFDCSLEDLCRFARECNKIGTKHVIGAPGWTFPAFSGVVKNFRCHDFTVLNHDTLYLPKREHTNVGNILKICKNRITSIEISFFDYGIYLDQVQNPVAVDTLTIQDTYQYRDITGLLDKFAPSVKRLNLRGSVSSLRPFFTNYFMFSRLRSVEIVFSEPIILEAHEELFGLMTRDQNCFPRLTSMTGDVCPSLNFITDDEIAKPKFVPELYRMLEANKERLKCAVVLYCILKKRTNSRNIASVVAETLITDCFWKHWKRVVEYRAPVPSFRVFPDQSALFAEMMDQYSGVEAAQRVLRVHEGQRSRYQRRLQECDQRMERAKLILEKRKRAWKRMNQQTTIDTFFKKRKKDP